jgi:hypothetical protein
MFQQLIACHPQGALVALAKISIKHEQNMNGIQIDIDFPYEL